jgi:ATP-binding cassette subfamily C (CFTR/MRP) protein 1
MSKSRSFYWFRGYAGLQMASIVSLMLSRAALTEHRTVASKVFHAKLIKTVLYMPVSFFDITPIGRILNRFSQDMFTMDEEIASTMSQVISLNGSVLGSLGAIAGSTKGAFLILAVPLAYFYSHVQAYFRKSNTAIARLESVSRSPIYADFSQTLTGTSTIRAYQQQHRFIQSLEEYANRNTVPGVLIHIAGQWLAIRLDILGAIIMFFMGALTVALQGDAFIPAGYLALGLSYSIQLTSLLKTAVRMAATAEAQFNAVERVKHYIDLEGAEDQEHREIFSDKKEKKLITSEQKGYSGVAKSEAAAAVSTGDIEMAVVSTPASSATLVEPPANWPEHGKVVFEDVAMRYRDGPLVLKGVSFEVNGKDKIGIAGRTG